MVKTKLTYFEIRFLKILKTKYFLITFSFLCLYAIIWGLIYSIGINTLVFQINITSLYFIEIIVYSILNITLVIYCIWKLFYDDNNDGVNKLEMRIGLTKRFMYFYRLILVFLFALFFLVVEYLLNSIFYAICFKENQLFAYRLFISSFGWLAFISFFSIFISLFFTTVFKSRFVIVFSAITTIILLGLSAISGNFISNKTVASNNSLVAFKQKQQINDVWWENALDDNGYVGIGVKYTNYYEFYQVIKADRDHMFLKFLNENYDSNLSNDENFENILSQADEKYESLNQFLKQKNASDLIKSKDSVLVKFGEILSNSRIFENSSKFSLAEDDYLKNQFYEYLFNSFLACEAGQEMDLLLPVQMKLIDQFNKKMKLNAYLNPLYSLNLMFFGNSNDYYLDNLINRTRPLFRQALNITYELKYEIIKIKDETDRAINKIIINSITHKQTISTSYLVSINVLIFIGISCLMYFGYKVKK